MLGYSLVSKLIEKSVISPISKSIKVNGNKRFNRKLRVISKGYSSNNRFSNN